MTAAKVRSNVYWILGLNRLVKKMIKHCIPCKKFRSISCEQTSKENHRKGDIVILITVIFLQ